MSVVLWERHDYQGIIVELEQQREQNLRSIAALQSAKTVGEVRAADLAPWARGIVDGRGRRRPSGHGASLTVGRQ